MDTGCKLDVALVWDWLDLSNYENCSRQYLQFAETNPRTAGNRHWLLSVGVAPLFARQLSIGSDSFCVISLYWSPIPSALNDTLEGQRTASGYIFDHPWMHSPAWLS